MKTIKSLKEITTLEVGDEVVFGNLEYEVRYHEFKDDFSYFLRGSSHNTKNDSIFITLGLSPTDFVKNLGIEALPVSWIFPEVKSLEALTAIVSALFKEYEKQQNELPKTWKEFCVKNKIKKGESYISLDSQIGELTGCEKRDSTTDRNVCISKQEAEAFLALNQLRQLRKAYVKDWEPDYKQQHYSCGITPNIHGFDIVAYGLTSRSMSFPTKELAEKFLTNFKDLLEIAKPLL